MPWLSLGAIGLTESWSSTPISGVDQDLIRLTIVNNSANWVLASRVLWRRVWDVSEDLPHIEKAEILYPSPERLILQKPVPSPDYVDAGLATFKIQARKYYRGRWRPVVAEPAYSLLVEVQ